MDQVAIITSIDSVNGILTVDDIPTAFTLTTKYDIIQTKNPFQTLTIDAIPLGINTTGNTITFNTWQIPKNLSVGDHVALAEQTIVPQIPADIHSMLSQRVAARCLEALGDTQGLQNANLKLADMENKAGSILEDRVEGSQLKVVNKHSTLKRKKLYWRS
jgi:PPE-repeat protein